MTQRVRAIIIADNRILLINRVKKDVSYWVMPGGQVELGESQEKAIERECFEELGVTIRVNQLFAEKNSDKLETVGQREFFYLCDVINGDIGTGKGPEFQPHGGYKGEYKISWVDLKILHGIDLKPKEIKDKIIEEYLDIKKVVKN